MSTAIIATVPTPRNAARYEVHFQGMERSRTLYVEDDKLHLQMTLTCDCSRCRNRESRILSALDNQNIPYTIEVLEDGHPNERFVCFPRAGEDSIKQVESQTGMKTYDAVEYPSVAQEHKAKRISNLLIGAGILVALAVVVEIGVWIYRFINPHPMVLNMMAAWASFHGIIMGIRCIWSEEKLGRLLRWLLGVGCMVGAGVVAEVGLRFGQWNIDVYIQNWPVFFKMLAGFVYMAGVMFVFIWAFCLMLGHICGLAGSWLCEDGEFS